MTPSPVNHFPRRAVTAFCLAIIAVSAISSLVMAQQGGTARYTYDDKGRLTKVVLPTGETAIYEYDPAGNMTAIRRTGATTVAVLSFSPREGTAGDLVTLSGFGFGPGTTDNTVSFNGVNARVVTSSGTEVVAEVPDNATTGLVTVTSPNGSATTDRPFTIVAGIRVSPVAATVRVGGSLQFTAAVTSLPGDRSVRWSVNGVDGGNSTVGTISASGLYLPPSIPPAAQPLVVRATSVAMPSLFAEAQLIVLDRLIFNAFVAVSVRRGAGISEPFPATSALVSVRRGAGVTEPFPAMSPSLSVRRGLGLSEPFPASSAPVSVSNGPRISAISPTILARGATVTIIINGTNLGGATALGFIDSNGAIDAGLIASNLSVNADGTQLSATLAVGANAALGRRVVVVSAATASSPVVGTGSNTIEITAQ